MADRCFIYLALGHGRQLSVSLSLHFSSPFPEETIRVYLVSALGMMHKKDKMELDI